MLWIPSRATLLLVIGNATPSLSIGLRYLISSLLLPYFACFSPFHPLLAIPLHSFIIFNPFYLFFDSSWKYKKIVQKKKGETISAPQCEIFKSCVWRVVWPTGAVWSTAPLSRVSGVLVGFVPFFSRQARPILSTDGHPLLLCSQESYRRTDGVWAVQRTEESEHLLPGGQQPSSRLIFTVSWVFLFIIISLYKKRRIWFLSWKMRGLFRYALLKLRLFCFVFAVVRRGSTQKLYLLLIQYFYDFYSLFCFQEKRRQTRTRHSLLRISQQCLRRPKCLLTSLSMIRCPKGLGVIFFR